MVACRPRESRSIDHTVEDLAEAGDDPLFDFCAIHAATEQALHRCGAAIGDATRDDQIEATEIRCDVQCEPVAGDPPRNADADGRQLFAPDPHAGQSFDATGLDTVVGRDADQDFFEIANVPVNIATVRIQVEDRVANDLAGTVICNIATSTRLEDLDVPRGERGGRREDVGAPPITANAQGQDVGMLDQQQQIAHPIGLALIDQRPLKRESLRVRHQAKPPDFDGLQ